MSRYSIARSLGTLRRTVCLLIGFLLTLSGVAALSSSSSAQAAQPTSFSILVNGSTSATIPTTGTAILSESGLPSTAVGGVTFVVNGDTNCELNLTGLPNEVTSCSAEPFPSSGPGTYVVTATFFDLGDNGNEFTLSSSNAATLTISGQTSFTISVNGTSSATIPPGASANLTLTGLPWSVAGSVTYSAAGTVLCTEVVSNNNQPGCYSSPSLPVGTYQVAATFVDTDGIYSGSQSSNSVALSVSTQTAFTISILNSSSVPSSSLWITPNSIVSLSETGLPSTAIGTVTFSASGTVLCAVSLTAGFEEATDCAPSIEVGTDYVITATFTDTNGALSNSTSSNSVDLNVYGEGVNPPTTQFTITVNSSSSATTTAGDSVTLAEVGMPAIATGTVIFSGNGYGICSVTLSGQVNEQTSCSSSTSLGVGTYNIGAEFSDPSADFVDSSSSNSVTLTVSPAGAPTTPTTGPTTTTPPASPSSSTTGPTTTPPASPSSPTTGPTTTTTTTTTPPVGQGAKDGYDLVGSDGGIFTFGDAPFYGSTGSLKLQRPVTGITPTSDHGGYWLVGSDGGIFTFGDAGFYGSIPGLGLAPAGSSNSKRLNAPIVGMVPSSDGAGYFMVAADGGVFAFGDAKFEGSCPGIDGCSGAAVAVMPDASGDGYWLVTSTGRVYAFGDAAQYGAPGPQSVPVTSAVRTTDGAGYRILFANGVIDAYGDATDFGGPTASVSTSDPATTIFTTPDGGGYWVASADGSVFTYGDAPYEGGASGMHLNGPIIAATGW
jgi:hypothetical protein